MTRWNPWRELRSRSHIRFALVHELPDGVDAVCGRRGDRAAIAISRELSRIDRRAALAHELVHDERGPPPVHVPSRWVPVLVKEEAAVDREVERRLVPIDALRSYVDSLASIGEESRWPK